MFTLPSDSSLIRYIQDVHRRTRRVKQLAFEDAKVAFDDVFARLIADPDHSDGEERFIPLGTNVNQLLVACYCEVAPDVIRIISARRASRHERTEYEGFRHA